MPFPDDGQPPTDDRRPLHRNIPIHASSLPSAARFLAITLLLAAGLSSLIGCAGYQLGSQTLYRPDLVTVAVPIFQSESLRRHLGERLTEAVVKEIELKTPYKVTQGANADSVLSGRLIEESKYAITENVNDEPRDIELEMFVEINWQDRMGRPLLHQQIALPPTMTKIGQAVHFVPEGGQSLVTAQQDAIKKLAEQIVARMEVPW